MIQQQLLVLLYNIQDQHKPVIPIREITDSNTKPGQTGTIRHFSQSSQRTQRRSHQQTVFFVLNRNNLFSKEHLDTPCIRVNAHKRWVHAEKTDELLINADKKNG
jgi:hypothetical protein